jgi:hypothetical protein
MSLISLKDDLLQEFREERKMVNEQIELLDPLVTSLNKPAARRLLSGATLIISEIVCYLLTASGTFFLATMHTIYPFSTLKHMLYEPEIRMKAGVDNVIYLTLGVYGMAALLVISLFILGRMARETRLKNKILKQARIDTTAMMGQQLERKAAIDAIEQRHMLGASSITISPKKQPVTEIINPAFA